MSEKQAKRHLKKMLGSFTPGSILHLLADISGELAEEARRDDDDETYHRCKNVEIALIVFGMGVDAACPR